MGGRKGGRKRGFFLCGGEGREGRKDAGGHRPAFSAPPEALTGPARPGGRRAARPPSSGR